MGTPSMGVANTLQEILARKKAEQRQAFLDDLTRRTTESQIAAQRASADYTGKLGRQVDENILNQQLGQVAPGTPESAIGIPELVERAGALGRMIDLPAPRVSTTTDFLADDSTPVTEVSEGVSPGRAYAGTYDQQRALEQERARGAAIADPSMIPQDPLARALTLQSMGAQVPADVAFPGQQMIFDEGSGKVTSQTRSYGPDVTFQRGYSPGIAASIAASAARSQPDRRRVTIQDPTTGLPKVVWYDYNAANPEATAIEASALDAPKPSELETTLLTRIQESIEREQPGYFSGTDPVAQQQTDILLQGVLAGASPAVRDVVMQVRTNPQIQQALTGKTPEQAAQMIAAGTGLNPADTQQLAQMLIFVMPRTEATKTPSPSFSPIQR